MKITDIDVKSKLIIKFKYKASIFSLIVDIIFKKNDQIIIPAILENNELVDPDNLSEVELLYTVKDGVYRFRSIALTASEYKGMRVYLASTSEDISRVNRRGAYRVFIGEIIKADVTSEDGKKKTIEAILKNISNTGMGIVSKHNFEIGTTMSVIYNFEGIYVHLLGNVVRKEKIHRYRAFIYGCNFQSPNNRLNRIVTQLQIRNKTLHTEQIL